MQQRTLEAVTGPGVDERLLSHLRSWGITLLTDIQLKAIDAGIAAGNSAIICAPTSSGKTLIGEIAVVCAIQNERRALYLVSHKALADQKYIDFERRFGENAENPLGTIGLSTGDRDEGDYAPQVLIATYEKALALLMAGQLTVQDTIVIADELQILGDETRGANIEALCAALHQRKLAQFVGLTATIANPDEIAHWLNCKLVLSAVRDIPLHQEIWYEGKGHQITFGQDEGRSLPARGPYPSGVLDAVDHLIRSGRGPVLVFTESRREAKDYAEEYSKKRARVAVGIALAEQLDLFSEPTEASESLRNSAERRVAFHTADLTPQERQVIEQGFVDSKFEACFATSTLAAGVNFPFKTAVFAKLTYRWGDRAGKHIPRSEYRNMSGRAGRLGLHDEGYSILLPTDRVELAHANRIVLSENDPVQSQLINLSMRRTVLMLIASHVVNDQASLNVFFGNTFFWQQLADSNPKMLDRVLTKAQDAVQWLLQAQMLEDHDGTLVATPVGKVTAQTGLLPTTAVQFVELVNGQRKDLIEHFDGIVPALLYWVCTCEEFRGETPSRFLPITFATPGSGSYVGGLKLFQPIDRSDDQVIHSVHALCLYVLGAPERQIAHFAGVSSGYMHRLAADTSWVLDGLHRLACVQDLDLPQQVANHFAMLAKRVRWGSPSEALDIIRIADRHAVPGFGRQRAMALVENGLATLDDILGAGKERLVGLLRNKLRVDALLEAISSASGFGADRLTKSHRRVAKDLGLDGLVAECAEKTGVDYEAAIERFLGHETRWSISRLDGGKAQNVPDIMISLGGVGILLECKTCTKTPRVINKEEAFAVLQKAADYDPQLRRVTLGKPGFDEHSKKKAAAASDITLIEHSTFVEGLLRVHSGSVAPADFLKWLGTPGVVEIDRLPGNPTFTIP